MEEIQMNFHKTLQRLRKEKGLSQEELGEKLGVSRQTISKWEGASAYPDMLNLLTISRFFEISVDELISGGREAEPETGLPETEPAAEEKKPVFHYEYTSRLKVRNTPLVHINYGLGDFRAKGIIAIGNISTGILSIGLIAKGLISIGVLSLGLLAVGVISLGLLAIACIGAGIIAVAGIALGIMTLGGIAFGVVSIGGCAFSTHISVGGVAFAPVAVGFIVNGEHIMQLENIGQISEISSDAVKALINNCYPDLPEFLKSWATLIFM